MHHRAQQCGLFLCPVRLRGDITVAAIPSVDLASLYVAQDEGLFAKVGLHVTIKKIPSSKAVIAARLKGQVDIGMLSQQYATDVEQGTLVKSMIGP